MSQERVSGFPEKGADLRGSPGTSGLGNFLGSLGNFRGNFGKAVKLHSERTSREVAEKLPLFKFSSTSPQFPNM